MIVFGPYHRESSRKPCSIASASVNALNADPAWRPVPPLNVARFSWEVAKSVPPAIARMCPVEGSIATSEAPGSSGLGRWDSIASFGGGLEPEVERRRHLQAAAEDRGRPVPPRQGLPHVLDEVLGVAG